MSNPAVEEPPHNEDEKVSLSLSCPLSSLPDEVALSCLARVSRSEHAALSLVSKRYRSFVLTPEFFKMRSKLGTEERLYLCLSTAYFSTPRWFILSCDKTANRHMSPIPSLPSQPPIGSSVVALDSEIYVIGGCIEGKPISHVSLLDCWTHTWRHVPSMGVARSFTAAGVVDGKIYVLGGCKYSYGEVFDPKTQTWDTLPPMPDRRVPNMWATNTLVMEEKVYSVNSFDEIFYYSPNEGKWGRKKWNVSKPGIHSYYFCTKEKLLYGCDGCGNVFWREADELDLEWNEVKGLEDALGLIFPKPVVFNSALPPTYEFQYCTELRKFGMNVGLIWYQYNYNDQSLNIWCAQISFERIEEKGEIWGKIEWSGVVATLDHIPFSSSVDVLYFASLDG